MRRVVPAYRLSRRRRLQNGTDQSTSRETGAAGGLPSQYSQLGLALLYHGHAMAALHPQLEKDGISIGRLELCRVLLMNDANFPWCILVPDRDDITEIYQLTADDQILLIKESTLLARCMVQLFSPDKLNVAALGNLVPQLHIHHIARFRHDPAWPAPVWGHTPAKAYSIAEAARLKQQLNTCLREALPPPA